MRSLTRKVLFILVLGLVLVGLGGAPSNARSVQSSAGTHQVTQSHEGARVAKKHKKHKK